MIRLASGTRENLGFKLVDILPPPDGIDTLVGRNPVYEVVRADEAETVVLPETSASISITDEMMALCLIDTTLPAFAQEGQYNLYFKYTNVPEVPRLGPFPFRIDD